MSLFIVDKKTAKPGPTEDFLRKAVANGHPAEISIAATVEDPQSMLRLVEQMRNIELSRDHFRLPMAQDGVAIPADAPNVPPRSRGELLAYNHSNMIKIGDIMYRIIPGEAYIVVRRGINTSKFAEELIPLIEALEDAQCSRHLFRPSLDLHEPRALMTNAGSTVYISVKTTKTNVDNKEPTKNVIRHLRTIFPGDPGSSSHHRSKIAEDAVFVWNIVSIDRFHLFADISMKNALSEISKNYFTLFYNCDNVLSIPHGMRVNRIEKSHMMIHRPKTPPVNNIPVPASYKWTDDDPILHLDRPIRIIATCNPDYPLQRVTPELRNNSESTQTLYSFPPAIQLRRVNYEEIQGDIYYPARKIASARGEPHEICSICNSVIIGWCYALYNRKNTPEFADKWFIECIYCMHMKRPECSDTNNFDRVSLMLHPNTLDRAIEISSEEKSHSPLRQDLIRAFANSRLISIRDGDVTIKFYFLGKIYGYRLFAFCNMDDYTYRVSNHPIFEAPHKVFTVTYCENSISVKVV